MLTSLRRARRNMRQAVVYARYSPGSTQTYQSIEGQLTECRKFAAANDLQIVRTYEDEHLTGRNDIRPAFQQLLKDSAAAKWDIVLVYAIDRFGRNSIEIAINKYHLQKNGKTVISATQRTARNVDGSKNLDGILLENFYIGMAEYYSEELSQKVTRGLRESYAKGNFTGGRPLLGYKVIDDPRSAGDRKPRKIIVIDKDTAPLVRYVFEEYAKGTSKKDIMAELTRRGYKNTKNKPLSLTSFSNNLTSRKYIGEVEHDGVLYTNIYPPLIDKATFETVQKRLARRKQAPAALKAKEDYILQGKAFCGHCGARMVGVSGTGRAATYYYYACGKKYKYHTCDKRSERKDFLEQLVVELTLEYVLEPKRMDFIADRVMALYQNEFNEENVKAIERRVAALEEEIEKAVNAFIDADSKMVRAKLNQRVEDLEAQKNELLNDRDGLVAASKIPVSKAQFIAWLKTFERGNPADKDFQKRVVDALINSFYLYDDKFIIYFNIDGGEVVGYPQASEDVELAENFEGNENTPTSTGGGSVRISKATLHHLRPKTNSYKGNALGLLLLGVVSAKQNLYNLHAYYAAD